MTKMLNLFDFLGGWLEHKWKWVIPVVIVVIPAVWALFWPGYFNMHDDLQMMRQLELEKCFLDGQIPCRWVPDMGYGYGYPLFNYYPQGPFLVGEVFRVLGVSFVWTTKLLFVVAFVGAALGMFILGRELWGGWGGLASSIFYTYAPYHSVDIYVRGAMNEAWGLIWFPIVLWGGMKLVRGPRWRYLVVMVLGWVGLFMSHNLMALIFMPVFGLWVLMWLIISRNWRSLVWLAGGSIWAFAIVAWFELPVLLEQGLVQLSTITAGYYNYTVHFVSLRQLLLSRFWGYGASTWGEEDEMSFQVGWAHWGLVLVAGVVAVYMMGKVWPKLEKIKFQIWASLLLFFVGWGGAFMTHLRSSFIWEKLTFLAIVQFPWRWLTIVILAFSGMVGFLVWVVPKRWRGMLVLGLLAINLGLYWGYFRPGEWGPLTDAEKFSGEAWRKLQTAGIYDYLPKTAKKAADGPPVDLVEVIDGEAEIEAPEQGTNWATFVAKSQETALVRVNILDFPRWRVFVDTSEAEVLHFDEDELGRIYFELPAGEHEVRMRLFDTRVRRWGNAISLVAIALLASSWWWRSILWGSRR